MDSRGQAEDSSCRILLLVGGGVGVGTLPVPAGMNSNLSPWLNWLPWKPVEHHIPLLAPQAKYFHGAEVLSVLIYQQTAILKWPENAEEIIRREKITEGW